MHKSDLIIFNWNYLSDEYDVVQSVIYIGTLWFLCLLLQETINVLVQSPSNAVECYSCCCSDCCFFHFSAWGESLFMSIQTCLMVVMYFYYTSRPLPGIIFPFLYGAICYVLVSGLTPMAFLVQFVSLNVVFLVISRVSIVPWGIFLNLTHVYSWVDTLIKDSN